MGCDYVWVEGTQSIEDELPAILDARADGQPVVVYVPLDDGVDTPADASGASEQVIDRLADLLDWANERADTQVESLTTRLEAEGVPYAVARPDWARLEEPSDTGGGPLSWLRALAGLVRAMALLPLLVPAAYLDARVRRLLRRRHRRTGSAVPLWVASLPAGLLRNSDPAVYAGLTRRLDELRRETGSDPLVVTPEPDVVLRPEPDEL